MNYQDTLTRLDSSEITFTTIFDCTKYFAKLQGDACYLCALAAQDLKGLRTHLVNLANASVDGKFIFSGSAQDVKLKNERRAG